MKKKLVFKIALITFLCVLLGICIAAISFLETMACESQVFREVYSPDKRYVAHYLERQCGATTGFNRQVRLVDVKDLFLPLQKGFQAVLPGTYDLFAGLDGTVLTLDGQTPIGIRWDGNTKLNLSYPKASKIYIQESSWKDVQVHYQATSSLR